ncbi:DUF5694 domain-containing protein [Hymenobacter endophyticus]|uniref:DUF5694 domain-containing protein n=1 Tax=Hymenobacter endophyticus TaxID=3076335 RepID=A0ABU3TKR7_9BACT|nr:DUF5694 domain-containing protein [Hymenobacter endophyticus]MDU0371958.1 DUF5694 domain-containing protein [Hymenobacter endophyticus]
MKKACFTLLFGAFSYASLAQKPATDVMIVGCDHLNQIYKADKPTTDVLTPQGQQNISRFTAAIAKYQPDMLVVEALPEEQPRIDSLYALYRQDKLALAALPGGRSEIYQVAFRLGKQLQLPNIYCANAPGGTSQGILRTGQNIEVYQQAGQELSKAASSLKAELEGGSLPLYRYLAAINQPELYNLVYRLRYVTPARVVNSRFTNPDAAVDTAFINPRYIGAELISVFKNRDYKIYSNVVVQALQTRPKRVLALFGAAHIGSLQSIFASDPEFRVVESRKYLKK